MMIEVGQVVHIRSLGVSGKIEFIDRANLYKFYYHPIQLSLKKPHDGQLMYRTHLRDLLVREGGEKKVTSVPTFTFGEEEMEGIKISYSRASTYLSCPQKHHFSYIERLKTKGIVRPLTFGGDFHKLMENRFKKKGIARVSEEISDVYNDLSPRQAAALGDDYIEDLMTIFSDYKKVWRGEERPVEFEHEFLIKLGVIGGIPIYFHGKVDEIYENDDIGEHKTFGTMPDMGLLAMNMQSMLYAKALKLELGIDVGTVRWDYIKSKPATYPAFLEKSKRFSLAANSNITDLSWLRACKERGIDDEEVLAQAEQYKQNRSNFFFRHSTRIVPQMVDSTWKDFKSVCRDIALRGETNKVKNIGRDCTWCDFRPICYAEFTGADVDQVKRTDFVKKED